MTNATTSKPTNTIAPTSDSRINCLRMSVFQFPGWRSVEDAAAGLRYFFAVNEPATKDRLVSGVHR